MSDVIGGVIIGALLLVLLFMVCILGSNAGESSIAKSCDTLGAFQANGVVYKCHKRGLN